jgi:integrase
MKLDIRLYSDGRYGFEWNTVKGRKQVRRKSLALAERQGLKLIESMRAGVLEVDKIESAEFLEFLQWKNKNRPDVTVKQLVEKFIESKRTKGRSGKHMRGLAHTLDLFAKSYPGLFCDVDGMQVEGWLNERKVGPRRWNNLLADIISLVRYARRQGLVSSDLTSIEQIERRTVEITVSTYTPEELDRMLRASRKEWLPVLVLGAFCGLRPEELYPEKEGGKPGLQWENILWDKAKIDVPAKVSKTRHRRLATMTDAALAWLEEFRNSKGPVAHESRFWRCIPTLTKHAQVQWKPDALRHSFASYRLAITRNITALAEDMGNSPAMIRKHYLDIKHEDEAVRWFGLRP